MGSEEDEGHVVHEIEADEVALPPTVKEEDGAHGPEAASTDPSPTVLVVDDSVDMRHLVSDILELRGYRVVTAASAAQAMARMSERLPDLVIIDLFMPGMSGFSLRALMLRRAELARVPVVVLSAYWDRPGETLDVEDVLTKPLNIDRLISVVERIVPSRRPEQA